MKLFPDSLLDDLAAQAHLSPRARAHHNIHGSASDPVQRFLVAVDRRSYFRPHRHRTRSELALVLRGSFDILTFDARGMLLARHNVGALSGNFAYETPLDVWHTLLANSDGATFLEVKQGPYDPTTASEFAAWAPPEGDGRVAEFMGWARASRPGDRAPTR